MVLRGGIILLAIYGFLMLALATRARAHTRSRDPTQRALARVVYLSVILLLFMHIVANYFVVSGFPHLFWPLLGLLFARVKPAEGPVRTESGRIVIAETAPAASAAGP
jgi:cytochrome b561